MAWIMLDGVDRCGKSTVAEMFKNKGFKVIHLQAPDKKYFMPGYCGPGYVDEMMNLYISHTGQNVVFDRTAAADTVWAQVYGRKPQLTDDDILSLREVEDQNDPKRILMYDEDVRANWKRCIANKEKLTLQQFNAARMLFEKFAEEHGFERRQLKDFVDPNAAPTETKSEPATNAHDNSLACSKLIKEFNTRPEDPMDRLERANAIRDILSKKRIVKSDTRYDFIEEEIRDFLSNKLSTLLGEPSSALTNDEVSILKLYCHRIKNKMESNKHE
jgi:hypothetical protein